MQRFQGLQPGRSYERRVGSLGRAAKYLEYQGDVVNIHRTATSLMASPGISSVILLTKSP